jgi:Polysaccharide biosynthesis enzyme WcbI
VATRSIFLVGNCQVRPLADALRMLYPEDEIIDILTWDFSDVENTRGAMHYLRTFDFQIRMPDNQCVLSLEDIGPLPNQQIIRIPSITFPAFHPDQVYARGPDGGLFVGVIDYHSAIGLWAWMNGASIDEASALFDDVTLTALGYDGYWEPSVRALAAEFEASDVEFRPFWLRAQRLGLFMHTVNHPLPAVLGLLAKSVAIRLGAPESIWSDPFERYLHDYCSSAVWPVMPVVGRRLGLEGSWQWRVHDQQLRGLRRWLEVCFASYEGVDPGSVVCHRFNDGLYDEVLGSRLAALRSGE